jgi:EpsI family protein
LLSRAFVVFACLVAGAGAIGRASHSEAVPARAPFAQFPMQIGPWRGVQEPPLTPEVLRVLGVTDYTSRAYFGPNQAAVGLYMGYYDSQRQGDTIHSPLNCLPGAGWAPVSKTFLQIPVNEGLATTQQAGQPAQIEINRYVIEKGLDRQLVLYWYQSHGRIVASEYWGRFYMVQDAVRLNRTDGALVRVIAAIPPNVENAEATAEQTGVAFIKMLFPHLSEYLPS